MGAIPHDTPKKNRLIGAVQFADSLPQRHFRSDIFRKFDFKKSAGWRALREAHPDHRSFNNAFEETRGRPKALSDDDLAVLEKFIESEGFDARTTPWEAMPAAAGLDLDPPPSRKTIQRALKTRDFRFCVACQKSWISSKLGDVREEYCRTMLERYPLKEDWHHVRFTDETHFGYGPQGKIYVCRRPWERECPDCLVEKKQPERELDARQKRFHAWAAVGYGGFKDGLHWYEVPSNVNGKMNLQTYHDQILQPIVGAWVAQGDSFVLEEDNDSGHGGTRGNNIVRRWKQANNITSMFNCPSSPDLIAGPIEKAWSAPKEYVRRQPHWDEETLKSAAQEGFDKLSENTVNGWIDDIPKILKRCADNRGSITGY